MSENDKRREKIIYSASTMRNIAVFSIIDEKNMFLV